MSDSVVKDLSAKLRRWKELKEPYWEWFLADLLETNEVEPEGDEKIATKEQAQEYLLLDQELRQVAKSDDTIVISDPTLRRVFEEIRSRVEGEHFCEDGMLSDDAYDHAMDQFDAAWFINGLAITRPLTLLYPPADEIADLIGEARRAICFGLPTAAIALCRATVEAAVFDIAVRIGRISKEEAVENLRMCDKISALLDSSVTKQSPLRRKIDEFIGETSDVIHVAKQGSYQLAMRLFETALQIIQELYGYYRAQMPPPD